MLDAPYSRTGPVTRELFRQPTEAGWAHFVDRYGRTIRRWCQHCWQLNEEEADELTQCVVVKLWDKMRTGAALWDEEKGRFHCWLKKVAYRAWLDARAERAAGDGKVFELLANDVACKDFADKLAERELWELALERTAQQVSAKEWQVFHLRMLEDLPASQVAARVDLAEAVIYNYTCKVRKLLKEVMQQLDEPA